MAKNEPAAQSENAVVKMTPMERFVQILELEASNEEARESGREISAQIITAMLEAETLEDAVAVSESGPKSAQDLVDTEWSITDFEVVKSSTKYQDSTPLGYYVRVKATSLETGEPDVWATGAPNVVTLLWKARNEGRLPWEVKITGKETANGVLLSLKPLKPRVVKG